MDIYKSIFKTTKFVGVQPITFNKDTYDPKVKYFTTYKLDGLRKLLLITKGKSYLISSKMEFDKLPNGSGGNNTSTTILDGELYKDTYYAFDILYCQGLDIRSLPLSQRIPILSRTVKSLSTLESKSITEKKYLSPYNGSVYSNFLKLKKKYSKDMHIGGSVDGIIFTPDLPYNFPPLKWKPTNLLSIDFKIKKLKDGEIALLSQRDKVFSYKGYPGIGIVRVNRGDYDKYKNGDVIEFVFKNKRFVPIKLRRDKTKSNYISVVLSNFKSIINPPNMKNILQKK